MAKLKIKWNTERILGISAMSISFITLLIFIYQTNLLSKQNYLSILPYLDLHTTQNTEDNIYEFRLRNHGVGPAIIESVNFSFEGKEYDLKNYQDNAFEVLKEVYPKFDSIQDYSTSSVTKGLAIPANSNYLILGVEGDEKEYRLLVEGMNYLVSQGLDFRVVYKSIQEEYWMIRPDSDGPQRLD